MKEYLKRENLVCEMEFKKEILLFLIFIQIVAVLFLGFNMVKDTYLSNNSYKCKECNIVLIIIDTVRADHISFYGYHKNTTPNLDSLAKKGVFFNQAISQGSWTATSVPSLITSRYPSTIEVYLFSDTNILAREIPTLPKVLQKKGYRTAFISSHPLLFVEEVGMFETFIKSDGAKADNLTNEAIQWIRENGEDRFFLQLHYMDVHDIPFFGNQTTLEEGISMYDEALTFTDSNINRLIEELNKLGIEDKTIIVFTSDHGEGINDHEQLFEHSAYLYDYLINVPLIIYNPKAKITGYNVDCQVQLVDIVPTMLNILGVKEQESFQGKNLFQYTQFDVCTDSSISEHIQFEFYPDDAIYLYELKSFRVGKWHLIQNLSSEKEPFELYNLEEDARELNNLIDNYTELKPELNTEIIKRIENRTLI